jgi:hypothetical protein
MIGSSPPVRRRPSPRDNHSAAAMRARGDGFPRAAPSADAPRDGASNTRHSRPRHAPPRRSCGEGRRGRRRRRRRSR